MRSYPGCLWLLLTMPAALIIAVLLGIAIATN